MGDLFSSQWILDSEFYNRTYRYVERLFPQPLEYKQNALEVHARHENYNWQQWLEDEKAMDLFTDSSLVYITMFMIGFIETGQPKL